MLPDMPFVTTSMLEILMERYRESDAPLVISRYGDVNAPPMLHGRVLFPGFDGPDGEGCGKHIVRRHRDDAVVVDWNPEALTDLDVPEDYERVKAELTV
jgi:CTP:molybdopterin cytidylyltransferase MocA